MTTAGLTDFGAEGYFVPFVPTRSLGLPGELDQLEATIVEAGLMNAAELDHFRLGPGASQLSISGINGADFSVGTATTALTFERIGHGEGARRCDSRALRLLAVLLSTALVAVGCGEDAAAPGGQNLTPIRVAMFPAGATLPVHAALTEGIFGTSRPGNRAHRGSGPPPSSWLLLPRASTTSRRACRRLC